MITCLINGNAAYPAASLSIKITYANQYVTDDGEYSYDITFPMEILENRRIFGNISRFDVGKGIAKFDDCKLYASGQMVLSGIGTVLNLSDTEVKLQIVGGKSRIKFNERLTQHYIDQIDLGKASQPGTAGTGNYVEIVKMLGAVDFYWISSTGQIGTEGKYVFVPTYDETNDRTANWISGQSGRHICNCAVHVNLNYLLQLVLQYEGYTILHNDFDEYPWNTIYIASAYRTLEFSKGLPHWTCYTFIDEYRKFFNASIHFDDIRKTVTIAKANELTANDMVVYEPLDEYSVDFDEDGTLNTTETSNLEYNLGDIANRYDYGTIPRTVLDYFTIYEFKGYGNGWQTEANKWDTKKKRTTIVKATTGNTGHSTYYIYTEQTDGTSGWQMAGFWNTLVRNADSDDSTSLNISPAGQTDREYNFNDLQYNKVMLPRLVLSVTNPNEPSSTDSETDDEGYSYISVQDAIEDDSSIDNTEDEQQPLFVYFLGKAFHDGTSSNQYELVSSVSGHPYAWPTFITDYRMHSQLHKETGISLSLVEATAGAIGALHGGVSVDVRNCLEIKFKAYGIPDPSSIFMFRNKRYICEKIEVEVKDDRIEPIVTGYFYMME